MPLTPFTKRTLLPRAQWPVSTQLAYALETEGPVGATAKGLPPGDAGSALSTASGAGGAPRCCTMQTPCQPQVWQIWWDTNLKTGAKKNLSAQGRLHPSFPWVSTLDSKYNEKTCRKETYWILHFPDLFKQSTLFPCTMLTSHRTCLKILLEEARLKASG